MTESTGSAGQPESARTLSSPALIDRILRSSFLWGGLGTIVFYWAIRQAPGFESWGQTLFCGHPLAYITTGLFWIGTAALVVKWLDLPPQRRALRAELAVTPDSGNHAATADRLLIQVQNVRGGLRSTFFGERLEAAAAFVKGRRSTDGLNAHLQYLAEFAGERLHNSYGLVRTITWAVPILGFLGTVIGITQAIQNLDPARLESSFGLVANGLGIAFGTTALALGLSLVLVFGTYLVDKIERSILADVELSVLMITTELFPGTDEKPNPLLDAETEVADRLLAESEALIGRHVDLWSQSLSDLQQRWGRAMSEHQSELESSLSSALQSAVSGHVEVLSRQREAQQILSDAITQITESQHHITESQQQIADSQSRFADVHEGIVVGQERLADGQRLLKEKLEEDQSNEVLDETLHTLSAAVHLLTSRVSSKAA